jgi:DNA polymerase III alpha subunit
MAAVIRNRQIRHRFLCLEMLHRCNCPEPVPPVCETWGNIQALKAEREVVGVYISGHPLDDHRLAIDNFCTIDLTTLQTENAKAFRANTSLQAS